MGCHFLLKGSFQPRDRKSPWDWAKIFLMRISKGSNQPEIFCVSLNLVACGHALVYVLVIQSFPMLWTVACQAPLFMEFSRQEYWSGLPFPPPVIFSTWGLNLCLLQLLSFRKILYHWATGEAHRSRWQLPICSCYFLHFLMKAFVWHKTCARLTCMIFLC